MVDDLVIRFLELVPKNLVSRGFGAVSEVSLPGPMQSVVNETFAAAAGIDVEEAEKPPTRYESLNSFFTRRLESDAREVAATEVGEAVCPVDGTLSKYGEVEEGTLIQAKGREYSVLELLDSGRHAVPFEQGSYATFYLSPRDYHRIHSPASGEITEVSYVPGTLFPVFPMAVENVDQLFCINERLISLIDAGEFGQVAVVMVGATCVGRISLTFHKYRTNQSYRRRRVDRLDQPIDVDHGEELGVFNLGSTVVVLFSDPDFRFDRSLSEGTSVEMGRRLGEHSIC